MIWLYRVFHDQEGYCVRVVLYEHNGTLIGYHKEPAVPSGRTAEELAQDIEWFKQAFELPILTIEEVETELVQQPPKQRQTQTTRKTLEELETALTMAARAENESPVVTAGEPAD
jgi:hypothetical protein